LLINSLLFVLTAHQMSHLNKASCAAVKLQNTQFGPLL